MTAVQIANQRFSIGFGEADNMRRISYFRGDIDASLTPDEIALLTALGIDDTMKMSLRPQLAEFFQSLKECRNDTSLTLSSKCEMPYYIIWSVLFANRRETQRRILEDAAEHREIGALGDATLSALVRELTPSQDKEYDDVFTLIPAGQPVVSSKSRRLSDFTMNDVDSDYNRVFTLIPA
jgi:hypothetical protein